MIISRPCIIIIDIISNIGIVVVDNFAVAIVITISCSFVFTKHWKLLFVEIRRFKPILIWSRTSQIRTFKLFQLYLLCENLPDLGVSRKLCFGFCPYNKLWSISSTLTGYQSMVLKCWHISLGNVQIPNEWLVKSLPEFQNAVSSKMLRACLFMCNFTDDLSDLICSKIGDFLKKLKSHLWSKLTNYFYVFRIFHFFTLWWWSTQLR